VTDSALVRSDSDALRQRLEEAEETLAAIRQGAVDAFVIDGPDGERVFTLETADRPYRVLVECMRQGALVLAPDGTVLFANSRFADYLDTPHARVVGSRLTEFVDPAEQPAVSALIAARHGSRETRLRRHDGSTLPAELLFTPLPLEGIAAVSVMVTDLTDEKQHQQLRVAQEALRHSEAALRDADRRKDEFLATLAHELRNPLAPVRNAVEILRLRAPADPDVKWAQDVIDRQVQRMARLVDELMDLSRITRNQVTLHRERITLSAIVDAAVETSQPVITQAGHRLQVKLPGKPIYVDGDLTRLAQVFSNILNNAAKYTDPGGRITISAVPDGRHVAVSITDTGLGIPAEQLPRVFEMFTQIDRSLSRSQTGLGVGLALVKRLVEMHGGDVSAASEGTGKGSVFTVRLPVAGM
jgi:PAS domain S-box-containing protein